MNNEVLEQLKQEYNEALKRMQDIGEIIANCEDIDTSHCGQDAKEEAHVSLNELLGMKVICVGGSAMKCEGCSWDCDNCVKVELVGGDYLCLAKPQQDKPNVINFDEEESNVMDDIKEKTEDFLNYLDGIFNTKEQ
jgi:hypothetical protein